jgi:hypothetical protein
MAGNHQRYLAVSRRRNTFKRDAIDEFVSSIPHRITAGTVGCLKRLPAPVPAQGRLATWHAARAIWN